MAKKKKKVWLVTVDTKHTGVAIIEAATQAEARKLAMRGEWYDLMHDEFIDVIDAAAEEDIREDENPDIML